MFITSFSSNCADMTNELAPRVVAYIGRNGKVDGRNAKEGKPIPSPPRTPTFSYPAQMWAAECEYQLPNLALAAPRVVPLRDGVLRADFAVAAVDVELSTTGFADDFASTVDCVRLRVVV